MTGFGKALKHLRASNPRPQRPMGDPLKLFRDPILGKPSETGVLSDVLPEGWEASTSNGNHFVVARSYSKDHFHGTVRFDRLRLDDLAELLRLSGCSPRELNRDRIVFLDTETTGVRGGTGVCPFLIGVGFFRGATFHVIQYFIRDFDEEPSMLLALDKLLARFDLIVTYNGRAFDLPLVENRCVLSRLPRPFERLTHFDLLFAARRLWRAGHGSCRLTALEEKLLRFCRGPDIPGSMIPRAYFDYLQTADARPLRTVFSHNVYDILSLAALAIHASDQVVREPSHLDEPLDIYSIGRLFDRNRERDRAVRCYEIALGSTLPLPVRVRILERLSVLYRTHGEHVRSLERCLELMECAEFNLTGYEGAAIFHEHRSRDLAAALELLEEALERTDGQSSMERRRIRVQARRDRIRKKFMRARTLLPDAALPAPAGN